MSNDRRLRVPGRTYFFSALLQDRDSDLLVRDIHRLRLVTRETMLQHPFWIDAIVVLPATIHTIWTLPKGDDDFSKRWSMLQALFARPTSDQRPPQVAKGLWQQQFRKHCIQNSQDFQTHLAEVYSAPVKAGLAATPEDWLFSSIHRAQRPRFVRTASRGDYVARVASG